MRPLSRIRARLGDFWWYSALLFVAFRLGDVVNAFIGLWLVPKFVPQEELGAVLPLTQFAASLALPVSVFAMAFQKHLNVLSMQGRRGQVKTLLRGVFIAMAVLVAVGVGISRLTMGPILERLRVQEGALGLLIIASGLITAAGPVYQNALQALKRFNALTVMTLLCAPIRLVVMVATIPLRALSAYFAAQTASGLWSIVCCVFSLRRDLGRSVQAEPYWTRENLRSFARYAGLVLLYYLANLSVFVEVLIIRQRLPASDSAAYYMMSRFAEIGTYLGATLLAIVFPFASESSVRGDGPRRLVLRSVVGTLGFGLLVALAFACTGGWLLSLVPGGGTMPDAGGRLAFLTVCMALGAAANVGVVGDIAADRFGFLRWFLPLHALYAGALLFVTGYGYFTAWLPPEAVALLKHVNGLGLPWVLAAMFGFNLLKLLMVLGGAACDTCGRPAAVGISKGV